MNQEPRGWRRRAVANAIMGGCAILLWLFIIVGLLPTFWGTHGSPKTSCLNNLKQLGVAICMYESEWDDHFPPLYANWQRVPRGRSWMDKFMPYARNKRISRCPSAPDRLTYSFNRRLSGISEEKIAQIADTEAVFESVNSSPENNNLNSDQVCRPNKDSIPLPGRYIIWPQDTRKLQRYWPTWARPNHEDITNVLYTDGHAQRVQWAIAPKLSLK